MGRPRLSSPFAHVWRAYWRPEEKLACLAVKEIVKRVAVGRRQQLALSSRHHALEQNGNLIRIPIMCIVRCELKMPFQLAVRRVERYH